MVILPVDQGFEHGPARSFAPNPAGYDPDYHCQLAIDSGCNAYAAPLGFLEAVAGKFAGRDPAHPQAEQLGHAARRSTSRARAVTGSVKDARAPRLRGDRLHDLPGLRRSATSMYEDLREIIAEAKDARPAHGGLGLPARRRPLEGGRDGGRRHRLRGADRRAARRARHQGQAAEGAHRAGRGEEGLREVQHPDQDARRPRAPRACRARSTASASSSSPAARRRTPPALLEEVKRHRATAARFGSIMGRNAFQRPQAEAIKLLQDVMGIYQGK